MTCHSVKMHVLFSCAICFGARRGMKKEESFTGYPEPWKWHVFTYLSLSMVSVVLSSPPPFFSALCQLQVPL